MIDDVKDSSNDFLLPTPAQGDPNAISIKVYLFGTPKLMQIYIYRKSMVLDVIRHIMTLYSKDALLSAEQPLKHPDYPEAYELRLIDDDEDYFTPLYDMGPLERSDEIGEFESLALVDNKGFKPLTVKSAQEEENQEDLKKRHVRNSGLKSVAADRASGGEHYAAQDRPQVHDERDRDSEGLNIPGWIESWGELHE